MSKFTSGKWWVAPAYPSIGGKMVCAASQTESSPYTVVAMYIENQADTCLIAAAPEMYELLRVFAAEPSDAEERIDELCLAFNEARKLLARIDGEEELK